MDKELVGTLCTFTLIFWSKLTGLVATSKRSQNFLRKRFAGIFYRIIREQESKHSMGVVGSIAHMIKGALGAGVLSGHVAYMKAGLYMAVPLNFIMGIYICYCLYILVDSAQILYRRTRCISMTYADVGEAALACHPNPKYAAWSKTFRIIIDVTLITDLFGSCACYQIIIAKSLKQLVENTYESSIDGKNGFPNLRVYMLVMVIPLILICLIRHLNYLAPCSVIANVIIGFCIALTIHYALINNPNFENTTGYKGFYHLFEFLGMNVFSMSCAGVVIAVENNMSNPHKFPLAMCIGMAFVVMCTFLVSFFGYIGYLEQCESPITVNFPMETLPKILKGLIALMIYITHALNFWVPFHIFFYYLKKRHAESELFKWEMIYRVMFVCLIALVAIIFPTINSLIGLIGSVCLSNMAFIWPNLIRILVIGARPGFGSHNWRLWWHIFLILVGCVLLMCGSFVNSIELVKSLLK